MRKLAEAANATKQALWQAFLPMPRCIPWLKFDVPTPNAAHKADLLFMPHNRLGRQVFKYVLTVVDVASRFKEAEPLISKRSCEIAQALRRIWARGPLKWPRLLQVDPGCKFMGAVTRAIESPGQPSGGGIPKFTATNPLLSDSSARLRSGCSVTNTRSRCSCLRAGRLRCGCDGFPRLLRHSTERPRG